MIQVLLFFLFTLSINSLFPILTAQLNEPGAFITLHREVIIRDSDDLFIQRITDATITSAGYILFTSSSENRVYVFDEHGTYLQSFGNEGRGPGEFNSPGQIEAGPDGTLFVIDRRNARISVWDSNYRHITEFDFMRGWNTHFKTNKTGIFVWSQPFRPMPDGRFALTLYEIKSTPWRAEVFRAFEYDDYTNQHDILSTWSKIAITDNGSMIATEGTEEGSYYLYIFDENMELVHTFGKEVEQPMHTQEKSRELQQRRAFAQAIETGGNISRMQSQSSMELRAKPHFINIELDSRNYLWVHRSKEFGQQEEIDIYTLEGEFKTMITLPPGEDEYRMLGIYGDKVLFRVTDADETPSLHIYRIEYGE